MIKALLAHSVLIRTRKLQLTLSIIALFSCSKDSLKDSLFKSPGFRKCNDLLSNCEGKQSGAFCTFGYKWGSDNPFSNAGTGKIGPETPGGKISFGFYEEGEPINTHRNEIIQTLSFDQITVCDPKDQIRLALETWSSHANLSFEEVADVNIANIRFAAAEIDISVGYPPYVDDLCSLLSGLVIFGIPSRNTCDGFQNLALHEIGHVLGLGHVNSDNVMNTDYSLPELGSGDIRGIQAIYGEK